jgi:hypothetical protein
MGPARGVQCTKLSHAGFEAEKTEQNIYRQATQQLHGKRVSVSLLSHVAISNNFD